MQPFVRFAVINLAERAMFFDFDADGKPTSGWASSFRACLVGNGLNSDHDFGELRVLFNVDESILDFNLEYWFHRMQNVNVRSLPGELVTRASC